MIGLRDLFLLQQFLGGKKVLARDTGTEFSLSILIKPGFLTESAEIVYFTDGYLESGKSRTLQCLDDHADDFRICFYGRIADEFRTHLCHFF